MNKPSWRPLKFKTPEELELKIEAYFVERDELSKPYTVTSLALFLDTSRETLMMYEDGEHTEVDQETKNGFIDTIKRAKLRIHSWVEDQLFRQSQVTGTIFSLKNNFGWKDESHADITSGGEKVPAAIVNYIVPNGNHDSTDTEATPSVQSPVEGASV